MLTLGWSDGSAFLPVNSILLSTENEKNRINEATKVDKRSIGYKRRKLSMEKGASAMLTENTELLKVFINYYFKCITNRKKSDKLYTGFIFHKERIRVTRMKQRKKLLAWLLSLAMLITGVVPGSEKKAEAKVTAMSPFTIGLNYLSREDGESVTAEEVSRKIKGDGIYYLSYTATSYTSAIKKLTLSTSLHTADLTEDFGLTIKKVSIAGTSYSFYDRGIWGLENGDEAGTYCVNLINPDCGLYEEDWMSWMYGSDTSMNAFGKDMEVMSGEKILIKLEVSGMGSELNESVDHMPQNPQTGSDGETLWDCVWFGHYGASERKLPIKWRVLSVDGNDAFLMADQGLDCWSYNEKSKSVTWKTCILRSWLNGYDSTQNKNGYKLYL